MPNPTLNWKKLARVSALLAVDLPDAFLNGLIYNPLNAGTYYNGAARVQGSGSAVTVAREQIATLTRSVYWTPNRSGVGGVLNNRGIVAMDNAAATPTMSTTFADTFAVNTLLAAIDKNPGAYSTWAAANPFTSGQFSGYYRGSFGAALAQTWSADVYECQEGVQIILNNNANTSVLALFMGAFLDPQSAFAADAETDGRRYALFTSGGTAVIPASFLSTNTILNALGVNFTEDGQGANLNHAQVMNVGAATTAAVVRNANYVQTDDSHVSVGGINVGSFSLPWQLLTGAQRFLGSGRQIGMGRRLPAGSVYQSGGADVAYVTASSNWTANAQNLIVAA